MTRPYAVDRSLARGFGKPVVMKLWVLLVLLVVRVWHVRRSVPWGFGRCLDAYDIAPGQPVVTR